MIYLLLGCLTIIIALDIKLLRSYRSDIECTVLVFVIVVNLISLCCICSYLSQTPEQSYMHCTKVIPDKTEYCLKYLKE